MKFEIEHKYLVRKNLWEAEKKPEGILIKQGYILDHAEKVIRVRVMGDLGFITIKGPSAGAKRLEYEYPIPEKDALELLEFFTGNWVEKKRYQIVFAGNLWEIDEFTGDNEGLLLAEIELKNPDDMYENPPWVGEDVTNDPRYYNSYLAKKSFKTW
jgi:adenylate cyclase